MARTLDYPLYVGVLGEDTSLRKVGGPYNDIDDALDCCWEMICDSTSPTPRHRLRLIETGSGRPVVRTIPREALPLEEND